MAKAPDDVLAEIDALPTPGTGNVLDEIDALPSPDNVLQEIDALPQVGRPTPPSVTAQAIRGGLTVLGGVGWVLDALRRGRDVLGHQIGNWAYDFATGDEEERVRNSMKTAGISWAESYETAETGGRLVKQLAPDYAKRNPWKSRWLWGLGHEIVTDPLNALSFFALGPAGKAAKVAGTLPRIWAKQAATGARALVQLRAGGPLVWVAKRLIPGARRLEAPTRVLLSAPRVVGAVGGFGRVLRNPLAALRGHLPAIDAMRHATRVADKAGPVVNRKLLALEDAANTLMKDVEPEVVEQVLRAGEHVGKHPDQFYRLPKAVQRIAEDYHAIIGKQKEIIHATGLVAPELGGNLHRGLAAIENARGKEVQRLVDELMPVLDGQEQGIIQTVGRLQGGMTKLNDEIVDLANAVYDPQTFDFVGTAAQQGRLRELNKQAAQMQSKLGRWRHKALRIADRKASVAGKEVGKVIPLTKKIARFDDDSAQIAEAIDALPNWMPHVVSEAGWRKIAKAKGASGMIRKRVWNDSAVGIMQRKFVDDIVLKSKSVVRGGRRQALKLKRALGFDEIDEAFRAAKPGTAVEQYATKLEPELVARGGIWGHLENIFGFGKPEQRLGRFYELDPVEALRRTSDQIVRATRAKSFINAIASEPTVWSKTRQVGWMPLRNVSVDLANRMGDVFVHPELAHEMRRVYTNMLSPDSSNAVMRGIDWFTSKFKRSVVGWWPAYQFRNMYNDLMLMAYNGDFSLRTVGMDGYRALRKKGTIKTSLYGAIDAAEFNRAARAYTVTFGEISETGMRGWVTAPENIRRLGYFADRLQRGRTWFQAAMETKRVLFDYSNMTDFERTYMRRTVPFWSWLRNNVKLQADQLMKNPAIIAHQSRLGTAMKGKDDMPAWVRGRGTLALNPDTRTNEERMLVGLDLPWADAVDLLDFDGGWQSWVDRAAFRLNPLLKLGAAVPQVVRSEGYFERPKVTGEFVDVLPDFAKDLMNIRMHRGKRGEYYTMDPRYHYLLRNIPGARYYSTLTQLTRSSDAPASRIAAFGTGLRVHRYRPWEERARNERDDAESMMRALRRSGDAGFKMIPFRTRESRTDRGEFERLRRAAGRR